MTAPAPETNPIPIPPSVRLCGVATDPRDVSLSASVTTSPRGPLGINLLTEMLAAEAAAAPVLRRRRRRLDRLRIDRLRIAALGLFWVFVVVEATFGFLVTAGLAIEAWH